jgi:hypothetical protein
MEQRDVRPVPGFSQRQVMIPAACLAMEQLMFALEGFSPERLMAQRPDSHSQNFLAACSMPEK